MVGPVGLSGSNNDFTVSGGEVGGISADYGFSFIRILGGSVAGSIGGGGIGGSYSILIEDGMIGGYVNGFPQSFVMTGGEISTGAFLLSGNHVITGGTIGAQPDGCSGATH